LTGKIDKYPMGGNQNNYLRSSLLSLFILALIMCEICQ
jgi:hypothetical protein